jgi:hypothetical protein
MADHVPVAVWSGELTLAGVTLRVHVLDDGMRIIDAGDFDALWAALEAGAQIDEDDVAAFARWQHGLDGSGG